MLCSKFIDEIQILFEAAAVDSDGGPFAIAVYSSADILQYQQVGNPYERF